jgi:hypothetical protein
MNDSATDPSAAPVNASKVAERADEVLLKLLDGIEKLLDDGALPVVETYEALCRAERARSGR